ncbi:MAG: YggS family pyridoxal phosphate-dependent enzyme [Alphaproteobacteria bacterium]|nr:YggS family pyridoxal phosphate-dependent enzyme [Alphaproteobacteria bacterium]
MTHFFESLSAIHARMHDACRQSPLAVPRPTLVAVSKTQPVERLRDALDARQRVFGENRVQEAKEKWPELRAAFPDVVLHLIGPLQTNKAKEALALFDVIETLDREKLAREVSGLRAQGEEFRTKEFYIQVNTGEEPQKAGVAPKEAGAFIHYCIHELKLPVTGLMCIPPAEEEPAPHFALLRNIAKAHHLPNLSMGMSGDFDTALMLGATHIRVGTALFGERD